MLFVSCCKVYVLAFFCIADFLQNIITIAVLAKGMIDRWTTKTFHFMSKANGFQKGSTFVWSSSERSVNLQKKQGFMKKASFL